MANNSADAPTAAAVPVDATSGNDGMAGAIWRKAQGFLPDMTNLYLQPLDPSSDLTLSDRLSLICQSARPVGEFLDLSKLNLPPVEDVTTRFGHNIETYLYNYFLLACVHLVLFSLVHFGSVLAFLCWVALVWFLYVVKKEAIDVGGRFTMDNNAKFVVAVVAGCVAIFFGNVSTLLISLGVFLLIVVGIHALVRDDTPDVDTSGIDI